MSDGVESFTTVDRDDDYVLIVGKELSNCVKEMYESSCGWSGRRRAYWSATDRLAQVV